MRDKSLDIALMVAYNKAGKYIDIKSKKNIVIAANIFGKAKTVLQMVAIPMLLLNDWPWNYFDSNWPQALQISNWFFYIATAMSLISGVIYVYQNRNVFKEFSK